MMGLDVPVILWRLVGFVVALGLPFGAGWYVEHLRFNAAESAWIAAQAQAAHDAAVKVAEQQDEDDTRAYVLAQSIESQRQQLEKAYAVARTQLSKALQRPVSCPAGGTLGDVVIPGDALRELRSASGDDARLSAAEPAASQPGQ